MLYRLVVSSSPLLVVDLVHVRDSETVLPRLQCRIILRHVFQSMERKESVVHSRDPSSLVQRMRLPSDVFSMVRDSSMERSVLWVPRISGSDSDSGSSESEYDFLVTSSDSVLMVVSLARWAAAKDVPRLERARRRTSARRTNMIFRV